MRALVTSIITLIALSFVAVPSSSTAFADAACRCKGCGCKGGSGWRGPDGTCVSTGKLEDICGSPPGAACKQEAAPRVCFGKQAAQSVTQ